MHWIVMIQRQSEFDADLWDMVYVDVEARSAQVACEDVALEKGEGRYCAFPAEYGTMFTIEVERIASVKVTDTLDMAK
jgi:hypothetical protein